MSVRNALLAQAAALRVQADALEQIAHATPDADADELLDLAACRRLGVGRDALKRAAERGELIVSRGPKQRLLVKRSALQAWLGSKPLQSAAGEWAP